MATILVVDDCVPMRDAVSQVLKDHGFDVLEARDGADALDLLRRQAVMPALVVLDLLMPIMTGQEFMDAVRSDERFLTLNVIAISGVRAPQGVEGLKVLVKPFTDHALMEAVRTFARVPVAAELLQSAR